MNRITFPLELGHTGPAAADLQAGLHFLIDKGFFGFGDAERQAAITRLSAESSQSSYGAATKDFVLTFQKLVGLPTDGIVNEATATALNDRLAGLGAFEAPAPSELVVSGMVRREDGQPLPGVRVAAFHKDKTAAVRLGEDTAAGDGSYSIRYEPLPGVAEVNLRVSAFGGDGKPIATVDLNRAAKAVEFIDLTRGTTPDRRIEGAVLLEDGLPAADVTLRLYLPGFGGAARQLAETTTTAGGHYAFDFSADDKVVSLEVRAVHDGEEISLSTARRDVAGVPALALNLVAPAKLRPPDAAEYGRLTADLALRVGQLGKLAAAREDDQGQDLTVLSTATGWDARLIALAATAEKLCADPTVNLPQEGLYGLMRAGLPSDKLRLAYVDPDLAAEALKTARAAGIIRLDDSHIVDFKTQFTAFANRQRMAVAAPGSNNSYGDLLKTSGLPQDVRDRFVPVYLGHRGTPTELWQKAKAAGLNDAQINHLQRQGKIAFLTGNSAEMTAGLMQKDIADPVQLVDLDLHRTDQWKAEARARANNDEAKLAALIPAAFAGATVDDRLDAYAEDMARKVRLAYPTHVVGRLIEQDAADDFGLGPARAATAKLVKDAANQGFRLGQTPVSSFLATHAAVTAGLAEEDLRTAKEHLNTLHRVYQITPTNEAMPALLKLGMRSAFDVVALSEDAFVRRCGTFLPPEQAHLVYRKARQVASVTYNLFGAASKLDATAPVFGLSAPPAARQAARDSLIKRFPSMESLFGSLDFCDCEHCRSVLSPAAYLVDLLQFIDAEPQTLPGGQVRPFDVLVERRPDLPNIPLTCENTQTALPYIDIVNEILEYYVAHGKLEADAARDTGDATTDELLAEPQNVIREAYEVVGEAVYPLALPFDLSLETVREFAGFFETPLARVLETLRPGDELFVQNQPFDRSAIFFESLGLSPAEVAIFADPDPLPKWHTLYGYASAAEATTPATDPDTGQRIDLNSAKALSRRLGVTFDELVAIVKCRFVNPELEPATVLYKLGVSIASVLLNRNAANRQFFDANKDLLDKDRASLPPAGQKRFDALTPADWQKLEEMRAFDHRLSDAAAQFGIPVDKIRARIDAIALDKVVVLADLDAGCSFDETAVRYADTHAADGIAFLKINLFARLWRKLGWTIEETDRALSVFVPHDAPFDPAHLAKRPLQTALIYLSHLKTLDERLRLGKGSRIKLLTLWSGLPTTGERPLYAQLFLTRGVLKADPIFDHPLGDYLAADWVAQQSAAQPPEARAAFGQLRGHLPAIQAALGLTSADIAPILADAGGPALDTAPLSLPNLSLLYRYGLLAKALKLPVADLIAIKQLSGLNPFKPLSSTPLAKIANDAAFTQTLRFIEVAGEVKDSGLKVEDLDYLLRHRFDSAGKYRTDPAGTSALLRTLAGGIEAIAAANTAEAAALTGETLQQALGLALPPDVVQRFVAMAGDTVEFTATVPNVEPADKLDPQTFAGEERIVAAGFKEVPLKEQSLTFRGVLFEDQGNDLVSRFDSQLSTAQKPVFKDLLAGLRQQAQAFFDAQLKKQPLRREGEAGFLDDADFETLFRPLKPLTQIAPGDNPQAVAEKRKQNEQIEAQNQATLAARRARIAAAFTPFLRARLVSQFVIQTVAGQLGGDPVLVESLLTDERLLGTLPDTPAHQLLDVLAATADRGLTVTLLDADGNPLPGATAQGDADTGPLPQGADGVRFKGYLEVPTSGAYRFYGVLDKAAARVELRFDDLPQPLILSGTAAADGAIFGGGPTEFLELKNGVPYRFTMDATKLGGGGARLLVQGETLPKAGLAQLVLRPSASVDAAGGALTLFAKALQAVQAFGLTRRELQYVLTHAAAFDGVSLSSLPVAPTGDTPAEKQAAAQRFAGFLRLAALARLKDSLRLSADDLVDIFEADGANDSDRLARLVYPLIATLLRRDVRTVQQTAEALAPAQPGPAFGSEEPLQRLWDALRLVDRFGVPVAEILNWASIVRGATTSDQHEARFAIARDVTEAVKARFDPESWQRAAQLIFDRLRRRQRDALAAHVMHQAGFDSTDQLYEFFLVDPGMEPIVQTSRIRLAIASVQLFIQRCFLNLEPKVRPSAIDSEQWQWMKNYRVWEANRKIFLFPENWLEPEFRDDKTPLYLELEGALLQGDVSADLAEDAFFNYLKKLEELARLEIIAMHIEDSPDPAGRTLHVIGRTHSQPYQYFYRRFVRGMWTPWEPVTAGVEGEHLAPVVWRDRLYLFWVTFMEKPDSDPQLDKATRDATFQGASLGPVVDGLKSAGGKKEIDVQLHWSAYVGGEWGGERSSEFMPVLYHPNPPTGTALRPAKHLRDFDAKFYFTISVARETLDNGEEGGVFVYLAIDKHDFNNFYLAGPNSVPVPVPFSDGPISAIFGWSTAARKVSLGSGLHVIMTSRIETEDVQAPVVTRDVYPILEQTSAQGFTVVPPNNDITLGGAAPAPAPASTPPAGSPDAGDGLHELLGLMKPLFYQDDHYTFYVEPTVTERTVEEWEEWVVRQPDPPPGRPDWWDQIVSGRPDTLEQVPVAIDPGARFQLQPRQDWLLNPATVLLFGDTPVGAAGRVSIDTGSQGGATTGVDGSIAINVLDENRPADGLPQATTGLNVVGRGGFNSALAKNLVELKRQAKENKL